MYRYGEEIAPDDAEAAKWLIKAAEQGSAVAQFNLGVMHTLGEGVPLDDAEAINWFRKAAEQGDPDAGTISVCFTGPARALLWTTRKRPSGF